MRRKGASAAQPILMCKACWTWWHGVWHAGVHTRLRTHQHLKLMHLDREMRRATKSVHVSSSQPPTPHMLYDGHRIVCVYLLL